MSRYIPETIKILFELSIEKITIIIRGKNAWRISIENKHLDHERNIQDVAELIKLKKAKGENRIKTWSKTYLKEYVKSKLTNPTLIKLFNNPSKENMFKELSSIDKLEFMLEIRLENVMSCPVIDFPISWIEAEIK